MSESFCSKVIAVVSSGQAISMADALRVLEDEGLELIELIRAAYYFRHAHFGKSVTVHILNNVQNGMCPEDCRYCAQSTSSKAKIEEYRMKTDDEILAEARAAHDSGAMRYCMVFSGTGPSDERVDHLCRLVREIKAQHRIEVCVSPGVVTHSQAQRLKEAGLDRLNHNLNTSPRHYPKICTTHTMDDRLATLRAAKDAGLAVCSGVIIGMGEGHEDVIDMAMTLRELKADSIPVNFLMPIPGIALKGAAELTPEYCLRVLCLFRFLSPKSEIRMAAGREMHLRSLEPLGLFVANSLFLQGYLNVRGTSDVRTLRMIRDLGFEIVSEVKMEDLLSAADSQDRGEGLKELEELRPFKTCSAPEAGQKGAIK